MTLFESPLFTLSSNVLRFQHICNTFPHTYTNVPNTLDDKDDEISWTLWTVCKCGISNDSLRLLLFQCACLWQVFNEAREFLHFLQWICGCNFYQLPRRKRQLVFTQNCVSCHNVQYISCQIRGPFRRLLKLEKRRIDVFTNPPCFLVQS